MILLLAGIERPILPLPHPKRGVLEMLGVLVSEMPPPPPAHAPFGVDLDTQFFVYMHANPNVLAQRPRALQGADGAVPGGPLQTLEGDGV